MSLQVLNLFLALLLSNFGSSSLSAPTADNDTNKIAEAFNRISRFINWIKRSIANGLKYLKNKLTNQISIQPGERPNIVSVASGNVWGSVGGRVDLFGFRSGGVLYINDHASRVVFRVLAMISKRSCATPDPTHSDCQWDVLCNPETSLLCVFCIFVYWM